MQKIILISGFGGSGKSTCAQLLWNALDHAAIFEADHLFRVKPFDVKTAQGREQIGRIKLHNSMALLENFMKEDFSEVIIEGLVWSQEELDAVVKIAKKHQGEVWCFWLKTSKAVRHTRVIHRNRDEADSQEFLDLVEQEIIDPTPLDLPDGHYQEIMTDTLSPSAVVSEMMRMLK